jgi:riboflavin biosynthesis pyrimidine reductase
VELYGGQLNIEPGTVYANFVSSIDGVAAIEAGEAASGGIISGRNEADRFVMGLLRAFADAVLVGAQTVRAEGKRALWTPGFIFPAAAEAYNALRRRLGLAATPRLVIVTARGRLDPDIRALQEGALVLTTERAAPSLLDTLPAVSEVRAIATGDRIAVDTILDALHRDGYRRILTEGGPRLFGQLVVARKVDELFLTVSPVLVGRRSDESFGLIHGISVGRTPIWSRLVSARRHGSHLFLRYRLRGGAQDPSASGGA